VSERVARLIRIPVDRARHETDAMYAEGVGGAFKFGPGPPAGAFKQP
jgi:hypothetical protein